MCGIFGYVAGQSMLASTVLDGLKYLEYRGYDSWGIAVANGDRVAVQKEIGAIAHATTSLPSSPVALGHTRWATHGGVTRANAHPHVDCSGRFALIHNGIVENYQELGARLRRKHEFLSQTDTEVLVHLLEEALDEGADLLSGLLAVFRRLDGLSAVAVLDSKTGTIVVAKNGSPLALGWGEDGAYLASDPVALLDHTRHISFLEDGQAARLGHDGMVVCDVATGNTVTPEIRNVTRDSRRAGLDGYAHFMKKEIYEQPRVLREIAEQRSGDAETVAAMIRAAEDVFLIGCGTASHAAMTARYLLGEVAGRNSTVAVGSETSLLLPLMRRGSLVIAFSQSGETIDVLEAVREAKRRGAKVVAIVNAEGSSLHRFADFTFLLGCGPERCVLATKSYTAKVAAMQLVASALSGDPESGKHAVLQASHAVESLLDREALERTIADAAQEIASHHHLFLLGRHRNYPQALEAALKIKEVSYLHAEGFAAGELKHGVIALIAHGTPCILLAPDGDYRREILTAAAEVHARGAFTIGISPTPEAEFDLLLPVSGGQSSTYEVSVTAQILAYELALLLGCDPDRPRNLAKSVTVK